MEEKKITSPIKAIRAKCLECSNGNVNEVRLCPVTKCDLYPFRFGKNPYRTKHKLSPEHLAALQKGRISSQSLSNRKEERRDTSSEGSYSPQEMREETSFYNNGSEQETQGVREE